MKHGIHFISGLPRSGSTLLVALFRQNPRFHADISSPVCPLYSNLQTAMSGRQEFYSFFDNDKRKAILRGLFESYYAAIHPNKVVFDTSRAWCSKISGIAQLFPDAKIICCVRNLAWVLDSIEQLVQRNAFEPSKMFNFEPGTVYSRADMLTKEKGMIRIAIDSLREAYYGPNADKLLLVTYESLASRPLATLAAIYRFIGEEPFAHNVDNVDYSSEAYDADLGTPGLHRVSGKVEYKERQPILPPDLFNKFRESAFWLDPARNHRRVQVI